MRKKIVQRPALTLTDIVERCNNAGSHFFTDSTLSFFHETLKDLKVVYHGDETYVLTKSGKLWLFDETDDRMKPANVDLGGI